MLALVNSKFVRNCRACAFLVEVKLPVFTITHQGPTTSKLVSSLQHEKDSSRSNCYGPLSASCPLSKKKKRTVNTQNASESFVLGEKDILSAGLLLNQVAVFYFRVWRLASQ